jgi:peptidoglycan DL-endopeptidase LytF
MMNAVLMVILFIGAIKHPHKKVVEQQEHIQLEEPEIEQSTTSLDSIDRLLDEYVIKKESEKVTPEEVVKTEPTLDTIKEVIAPKKVEPRQEPQKMQEITVVSGDSLDKLARRHSTTVQEIMRLNSLSSSTLQIGQVLYVAKSLTPSQKADVKRYYVVKSGDSPWTIASKNNLKLHELLKLNNLNDTTAKKLKPGCRLRIK